jgi:GxxExxY protein
MGRMAIVHRELSYRVVGCAMHVHREIGPGLEESFYHQALYERLLASGVPCQYKPTQQADIWCDGRNLGPTVAESFVVGGRCAVKILALYERLHALHRATLQTELKHLGLRWGVLANFGKKSMDWQFVVRA